MMTESEHPWYLRRKAPVFCNPCRAMYEAVFPARQCTIFLGVALWIVGLVMIMATIFTCVLATCSGVAASLCPVGLILMFVGYGLFHCGWAAYLLDEPEVISTSAGGGVTATPRNLEDGPFETAYDAEGFRPIKQKGFWQFAEEEAWQAVSTRDRLQ